jgi:hypothetical protein
MLRADKLCLIPAGTSVHVVVSELLPNTLASVPRLPLGEPPSPPPAEGWQP